jgi:hypothetical protein
MVQHNKNYSGQEIRISIIKNGFIITKILPLGTEVYGYKTFQECIDFVAKDFGLLDINEKINHEEIK